MISEKDIMKLQNGSDVRGVAVQGVTDEPVTLSPGSEPRIAAGFIQHGPPHRQEAWRS